MWRWKVSSACHFPLARWPLHPASMRLRPRAAAPQSAGLRLAASPSTVLVLSRVAVPSHLSRILSNDCALGIYLSSTALGGWPLLHNTRRCSNHAQRPPFNVPNDKDGPSE